MSIEPRMRRLFAADGRCFDVAVDHGFFGEFSFGDTGHIVMRSAGYGFSSSVGFGPLSQRSRSSGEMTTGIRS